MDRSTKPLLVLALAGWGSARLGAGPTTTYQPALGAPLPAALLAPAVPAACGGPAAARPIEPELDPGPEIDAGPEIELGPIVIESARRVPRPAHPVDDLGGGGLLGQGEAPPAQAGVRSPPPTVRGGVASVLTGIGEAVRPTHDPAARRLRGITTAAGRANLEKLLERVSAAWYRAARSADSAFALHFVPGASSSASQARRLADVAAAEREALAGLAELRALAASFHPGAGPGPRSVGTVQEGRRITRMFWLDTVTAKLTLAAPDFRDRVRHALTSQAADDAYLAQLQQVLALVDAKALDTRLMAESATRLSRETGAAALP